MILTTNTQLLELIINGLGELDLNSNDLSLDTIDGVVIDNSHSWIPEDERPHIDFSIKSSDLIEYIENEDILEFTDDIFDPVNGHDTRGVKLEIHEIEVNAELIKDYLKQGGEYEIESF